jgi:hypothetical protein
MIPATLRIREGCGQVTVRIALRHYRYLSRAPYLELAAGAVSLRLPSLFGGTQRWDVPVEEVVVVDTRQVAADDPQDGWVFRDPLRIPYAATTSPNMKPNLVLLFSQPQRIPRLRMGGAMTLGLRYRASRRSGVNLDGVRLRAKSPGDAIDALAAAGVARVERPTAWLREHRSITNDPGAIQAVARRRRRVVWLYAVFFLAVILASVTRIIHGSSSRWLLSASVVAFLGAFALTWWANRDSRGGHSDDQSASGGAETRQL